MAREATRRNRTKTIAAPAAARVKMAASVRHDTYMKLATHALWSGKTQGQVLDELIDKGCRRYRVSDFGEVGPSPPPVADPSDSGDETAAA